MSRVRARIRDKLSKKQSKHGESRREDDPDLEQMIETEEQLKARAKVYVSFSYFDFFINHISFTVTISRRN